MTHLGDFGLPIGPPLDRWEAPPRPSGELLEGRTCRLEPLDASRHAASLFDAWSVDDGRIWTYLPFGPPRSAGDAADIIDGITARDSVPYAIVTPEHGAVGMASFLRIDPPNGSVEVGALCYAPALARTTAATEAMFLMADHVFGLGYRRYEWKCDSLNAASNAAARRLGFRFEGTFRNAMVYKGRSRDTNWLSITDAEWPAIRTALVAWLDPANFDEHGAQHTALAARVES